MINEVIAFSQTSNGGFPFYKYISVYKMQVTDCDQYSKGIPRICWGVYMIIMEGNCIVDPVSYM